MWYDRYKSGYFGKGGVFARAEIDAYLYQYHIIGDKSSYVLEAIDKYNKDLGTNIRTIKK